MSKQTKKGNVFTYTPTYDLPKLPKKIPTEWDMEGLYYKSINDPQIEKDVVATEKAYKGFVKKYQNSDFNQQRSDTQERL